MFDWLSIIDDFFDFLDEFGQEICGNYGGFLNVFDLFVVLFDKAFVEKVRYVIRSETLFFYVFLILFCHYSCLSVLN